LNIKDDAANVHNQPEATHMMQCCGGKVSAMHWKANNSFGIRCAMADFVRRVKFTRRRSAPFTTLPRLIPHFTGDDAHGAALLLL
jgi:hypothetical protein